MGTRQREGQPLARSMRLMLNPQVQSRKRKQHTVANIIKRMKTNEQREIDACAYLSAEIKCMHSFFFGSERDGR